MFREHIAAVDGAGGWPVYVIGNHDIVRAWDRYGDGKHNDAIAKVMAALYLTLRGTPILYYGEELGMQNNNPTRREDVKDPIGQLGWPQGEGPRRRTHADAVGRDARTPASARPSPGCRCPQALRQRTSPSSRRTRARS